MRLTMAQQRNDGKVNRAGRRYGSGRSHPWTWHMGGSPNG
jgi:hypothetical protein